MREVCIDAFIELGQRRACVRRMSTRRSILVIRRRFLIVAVLDLPAKAAILPFESGDDLLQCLCLFLLFSSFLHLLRNDRLQLGRSNTFTGSKLGFLMKQTESTYLPQSIFFAFTQSSLCISVLFAPSCLARSTGQFSGRRHIVVSL